MDILRQNTYTSPDYIEHWGKHFEVQVQKPDGSWTPITDMNNFHTRIVLGAEKAPSKPGLDSLLRGPMDALPGLSRPHQPSMYFRVAPGAFASNPGASGSPATRSVDGTLPGERVSDDDDRDRKQNRDRDQNGDPDQNDFRRVNNR
jgi:hypothetical protein